MVTIDYVNDASGEAVPDYLVEDWIEHYVEPNTNIDFWRMVSTENVIHAIRARIAEGRLSHDKIKFRYNGTTIDIDRHGELREYPDGFCDTQHNCLMRLL